VVSANQILIKFYLSLFVTGIGIYSDNSNQTPSTGHTVVITVKIIIEKDFCTHEKTKQYDQTGQ
ncbi:hypothetical protein R0K04_23845, partial [Pseudoalteromonas sp. SIMBA_153]